MCFQALIYGVIRRQKMLNDHSDTQGLTALEVKYLQPKDTRYDVADITGLYLCVYPNGTKSWRISKSVNGKRLVKVIGSYPDMSIAEARSIFKSIVSPNALGQAKIATFENIFKEFIEVKKNQIIHWKELEVRINKYLIPDLGKVLWNKLTPIQVLNVINKNVPSNLVSIKFHLSNQIAAIEKYAVNTGRAKTYQFQSLKFSVPKYRPAHMASIHYDDLPEFMALFYRTTYMPYYTKLAKWDYWSVFLVGLFTLVRPKEYLSIKWEYIDFDKRIITIPAENMKMKKLHEIPMSDQLVALLSNRERESEYIFPQMKEGTYTQLYTFDGNYCRAFKKVSKETGKKLVPHGIRAMGRTWMSEHDIDFEVAENCLAHSVGNAVVATYNRTTLLEKRRVAMQKWANFIEECFVKSKINEIQF